LRARGARFIGPEEGLLACGYEGIGRLWPVEEIATAAHRLARKTQDPAAKALPSKSKPRSRRR